MTFLNLSQHQNDSSHTLHDDIKVRALILCMMITPSEIHTFIPVLMTLTCFHGHSDVGNVKLEKNKFSGSSDLIEFNVCVVVTYIGHSRAQTNFCDFGVR